HLDRLLHRSWLCGLFHCPGRSQQSPRRHSRRSVLRRAACRRPQHAVCRQRTDQRGPVGRGPDHSRPRNSRRNHPVRLGEGKKASLTMFEFLSLLSSPDLWASTARLATPIAYAALAAMICERSGVINIALEGMLLTSAFCAILGSYFSGNAYVGIFAGLAGS